MWVASIFHCSFSEIFEAIDYNYLLTKFSPVDELTTGVCDGCPALCRWCGVFLPDRALGLARETRQTGKTGSQAGFKAGNLSQGTQSGIIPAMEP